MKTRTLIIGLAFCVIFLSVPALADDKDARIETLEKQVQILMGEIQTLKSERAAEKEAQQELRQQVSAIEEKTAVQKASAISPAAGASSADDVQISMSPSPKITKGDMSWQPFGRIHLDAAHFEDDKRDHPSGAEFRRARLGMKGQLTEDVGYRAEFDFANEGVSFKDVYMNYTGVDGVEIRAGNFKPPMGLEESGSSNYLTFIEPSSVTSSFLTGEIIGLAAFGGGENWSLAGGIFNDDPGIQSSDDEAINLTGRVTFAPVNNENATLHLGAAASRRTPDDANETFDFDAYAENALQSADSVSAVITNADRADLYGLEAAALWGPVSLQGEYFRVNVDDAAGRDPSFDGGYGALSWIVTGERRPYSAREGTFGRVVPDHPLDPAGGGWGAVELAARYSTLDLNDSGITGGQMDNITAGINWYLAKHVRLMANYIIVDTDNSAPVADDDPRILLFRAQTDF